MPLTINIVTGSNISIYKQIVEQVGAAVFSGSIAEDEMLPSVRALAEQLVINPNTVSRAYGELVREGVLESRAGRGMFVARRRRQIYSAAERTRRIEEIATTLVTEGLMLGFGPDEIVEFVGSKVRELKPPSSRGGGRSGRLETMKGPAR
jgi:GntR family transcriptional regulator